MNNNKSKAQTLSISEEELDKRIGDKIKRTRSAMKITQAALGEKVGVSFQQIQKYENGKNRIGAGKLFHIARALRVPVYEIFGEAPSVETPPASHFAEEKAEAAFGSLRSRHSDEAIELLAAFDKIGDVKLRKQVIDVAQSFAKFFIQSKGNS